MNEGVGVIVEVNKAKIERRLSTKYLDTWTDDLDEALEIAGEYKSKGEPISIGLLGNAADVYPEFVRRKMIPDVVTDQTAAHDELNGYVPAGISYEEALELREKDPEEYIKMSFESMVQHVQAMIDLQNMGSVVFDYGNNIRGQAERGGLRNAFSFPGFVPAYIRPMFCQGKGPFRWAALSGDPQDIYRTD